MKSIRKTFFIFAWGFCLLFSPPSLLAEPCPTSGPELAERTTVCCDPVADPVTCTDPRFFYKEDRLCIAEPVDGLNIDDNSICILGKFRSYADYQAVGDLVAAVTYPLDVNAVPDQVMQPGLDQVEANAGSFGVLVSIPQQGDFQAIVKGQFFVGGSDPANALQPVTISRGFVRIGSPNFTVSAAKESSVTPESQAVYTTEQGGDFDGDGTPDAEDDDFDGDGENNDVDPDDDGDRICDDVVEVVGECVAGLRPDPLPTYTADITGPAELGEKISASAIDLCFSPPEGAISTAGTALSFTVDNRITDTSAAYEKILRLQTVSAGSLQPVAEGTFCSGGFVVSVPLGHGENLLEITVDNEAVAGSGGEKILVGPIANDIRGPELCIEYLTPSGQPILDPKTGRPLEIDGKALPASLGLTSVMIDATPCGTEPDTIAPQRRRRNWGDVLCGDDSICFQANQQQVDGETPLVIPMNRWMIGDTPHYRATMDLRFPVNTYTIWARDVAGNQTVDQRSFGYGSVRPLIGAKGNFQPRAAMIPDALSLHLPDDYVEGEVKNLVFKVLNSEKFTDEILPELLAPHQLDESVLEGLREASGCAEAYPSDRTRVIQLYHPTIKKIEMTRLEMIPATDSLLVSLRIEDLEGEAEAFTLRFIDSDGDKEFDTEDDDDDNDGLPDADDPDDDNDGNADEDDFPGELVTDPVLGTADEPLLILPLKLTVEELKINLQIQFVNEAGSLKVLILRPENQYLIETVGKSRDGTRHLVQFDCDREEAHTCFDGDCSQLADRAVCEWANRLEPNDVGVAATCDNQDLDSQFSFTLKQMLLRVIPHQVEELFDKLVEERLTQVELEMDDKTLAMDLFADPLRGDIRINDSGLNLRMPALVAPAGFKSVDSEEPLSAFNFLRQSDIRSMAGSDRCATLKPGR